jgi:hypothetical protein
MTKTLHRYRIVACSVLALGLLQPAVAAADAGGCQDATISGQSQADATGAFIGAGKLGLDGKILPIQWVSTIKGNTVVNGNLTLFSSHHVTDSQSIDFTTSDVVTLYPTGGPEQYTFSSHLTVIAGVGRIHRGFLDVTGRVDLNLGTVMLDSSSGSLCAQP